MKELKPGEKVLYWIPKESHPQALLRVIHKSTLTHKYNGRLWDSYEVDIESYYRPARHKSSGVYYQWVLHTLPIQLVI